MEVNIPKRYGSWSYGHHVKRSNDVKVPSADGEAVDKEVEQFGGVDRADRVCVEGKFTFIAGLEDKVVKQVRESLPVCGCRHDREVN